MANDALGLLGLPSPPAAHCFRQQIAFASSLPQTYSWLTGGNVDYELESIWTFRQTPPERGAVPRVFARGEADSATI
jgi:hypothetical protein